MRKMALAVAVLAGGASFVTAGCGSSEGGRSVSVAASATSGAPAQEPSATVAPTATAASSPTPRKPAKSPGRSPAPRRTTSAATGSAPPWCMLADLRFSLSLGSGGGVGIPGSLLMTNTSVRRCALSGYLLLTWRDANGAVIAVSVNKRPDPQTPHTVAIAPGGRGIVGLGWQRYKSEPPPVLCTPVPKTLEVRLPPTVQNPHPENGPAKRISWFTGDSAGMCGPKVDMLPVDVVS
ncbi:DUF4232 domain-containing protein [Plantactinospora sp. CA-294935]|uniref:DUF4232 domain-containing protein n=1 Tax=Plantactinospora sp. CA-294935 TaxID=3240012 RepID=UPI003D8E3A6B